MPDLERAIDFTIAASVFGLVLAAWIAVLMVGAYRYSKRSEMIEKRLRPADAESGPKRVLRLWHDGQEATVTVPSSGARWTLGGWLSKVLRDAGINSPPHTVVLAVAGAMVTAFLIVIAIAPNWILAGGLSGAVLIGTWVYVEHRRNVRASLFERQLVDAISLASRSLRAGHPLSGAFYLIGEEMPAPIGPTFQAVCQQQAMGASLERAIRDVAAESESKDMKIFATSVMMQLRSGGNLADMMDRLAAVMRERIRLARRVRVLTAQTQMSKRVLLLLPVAVFLAIGALNPGYIDPLLHTHPGKVLTAVGVGMMLLGWFAMNRVAKLRY
jgi:tight adherence protein B